MDFLNAQFWKDRLHGAVVALILLAALVPGARGQLGLIPSIDVQPLGQSVKKGGTAVFTVEATSLTTMSYQWYWNSNAIAGATGQTYTRANLDFPDAGFYHVVIVNFIGSTKSDAAELIVLTNTVPVGVADTFTTLEDVRLTVPAPGVLTNDLDAERDALSAVLVSNVVNGILSFNADGGFVYTPNTNFFGSDSFSYYARDGDTVIMEENASGGSSMEINQGTVAQSFQHGTAGDPTYKISKVTIRLSKKAGQVPSLNFSIGTGINSGAIAGSSYTITMSSISNATDGASFQDYDIVYGTPVGPLTAGTTYYLNLEDSSTGGKKVYIEYANGDTYPKGTYYTNGSPTTSDMTFDIYAETISAITTVTLNVTAVNDAPLAVNDSTNTLEDTSVTIRVLANDSDVEGSPLSVTGASTTNGTAIPSGNDILFTPSTNFYGTVVFNYTVSDGVASRTGLVTVVVAPVNDASPVANNDAYTVSEDATLTVAAPGILTNDTDMDGDAMTALLVSNVSNGVLTFNSNGSFTYRANTNFNGADSFTYRATDGWGSVPIIFSEESTNSRNKVEIKAGQKGAQAFQRGVPGGPSYTISKVVLQLSRESTAPNTNLNFSIGTGVNSNAIAGSIVSINPLSITNTSAGSDFQAYEIVFGTPVGPLTAGTTYYLNLESEPSNGKRIWSDYDDQDQYANGTYYKGGNDDGRDMVFQLTGSYDGSLATVTINVTAVNDAPRAVNDSTNTLEDTSVTIKVLANDSDVEGTPLTISSTSTTNGTAVVSGTNIVFTPSTNFYGTAVFTYTVSDGFLSATGTVTVTVAAVNDAPRAVNDSTNTTEDTSVTIKVLLNDSDVEGTALTISSATTTNGTAVVSGTNIVFTPATNFNGTTVFSYVISDGSLSATGSVTVAVAAVNDAPIAVNDSTNTLEDVSVTVRVLANDTDVEGTALTLTSATTTNGTATISGTNVVFRAATNFFGTVVFSYVVSDGNKSATGSVTVAVASVNDAPPVANNDTYTTPEDVPRTVNGAGVLGNDTDVDGDAMTAILVSTVSNGTLSFNSNGRFTYTPNTNFYGTDSFTYRASDGMATGNVATVTITVTPVNDAPIVNDDSATVMEDTWIAINVLTNDVDPEGTLLNFTAITGTNGTYATTATNRNVILFLPSTNYNGLVVFSYTVSDGTNSATAKVTVSVTPAYDAPVAINDSTNTVEDVSVTIQVLANDYNPDGSTLTITNAWTTNGTAVISGTNVIFTPLTNFNGTGFVFYAFSDGFNSSTGTVTVTVTAGNDAPRGTNDTYTMLEDTLLTVPAAGILTNDFDVDGDPLTAFLVSDVSNGTLILNTNGSFTYRPNTNFNGSDSFSYVPSDGQTFGNLAIVTINITAVDDAPIAGNDAATVAEDSSISIKVLLNDSDPEGSPLTITSATPTNGTAVISGTNIVFTPPANFNGTSVFTYTISDGVYSATGRVTVTVTAVNDAPVANADSTNTLEDVSVTIKVLANDTDIEGTALSLTSATTTNGTAVISGTNIVFTPATNFNGTVVFTYKATDGNKFATGTVTVVVTPVNDGPVANSNTYTTPEDVPLVIPAAAGILADDLDVEGDLFTAVLVSDVSNGSLSLNPDGSFTYTPNPDYNGTDSFTYRGTDGLALGNVATVSINVTPVVDLLRFVSQKRVTNGMRLELSGPNASPYVIEASSNLVDWVSISTNFAPFGNVVFTDTMATNQRNCYYRAMIPAATNLQQNATGGTKVEIDPVLPGAQSFRHGSAGGSNYGISKIVIRISRDSPAPNGNLIFSIGTGVNSGAFVGSTFAITPGSVTNNSSGTTFQRYEIVYPEPIGPFTAGTTYYLNFVSQSANGESYWLERSAGGSTYNRGTFYSAGSDISRDMRFEIWGE